MRNKFDVPLAVAIQIGREGFLVVLISEQRVFFAHWPVWSALQGEPDLQTQQQTQAITVWAIPVHRQLRRAGAELIQLLHKLSVIRPAPPTAV